MRCAGLLLALGAAHALRLGAVVVPSSQGGAVVPSSRLGAVVPSSRGALRCRAAVMEDVSAMSPSNPNPHERTLTRFLEVTNPNPNPNPKLNPNPSPNPNQVSEMPVSLEVLSEIQQTVAGQARSANPDPNHSPGPDH